MVGGGGSIEWEDWARGPRRARGGGRPVCPSSTRPVAFFPGGGRGEGRGEVEEEEERHGGRVGRGGAAYDPARRVPRVSSYTLPRTIDNEPWRTAVVYCREFFG